MKDCTPNPAPCVYPIDMPRRKMQMKGNLTVSGNWWRLRYYEDVWDKNGKLKTTRPSAIIGPAKGPGKLSKKEAQQKAWDDILCHVNAKAFSPSSMMSVRQFIEQRFEPEVVWSMKHSGKKHYAYCFKKLLPFLGDVKLRDVSVATLQGMLRKLLDSGYSIQTVTHAKNAVSAIISHAKQIGFYTGENPASMVRLPEMTRKKKPALNVDQCRAVLALLPEPIRTMALMSMTTSLNNAEVTGLTWKYMNLTNSPILYGDEIIPPLSFGVFENVYEGRRGTVKVGARNRIQPIPAVLIEPLRRLATVNGQSSVSPDAPVFASSVGTPIDLHNVSNRIMKKVGKAVGIPGLSWQCFRRTAATLTGLTSMPKADRIALMGHSSSAMTDYYSDGDVERRRGYLDDIAEQLVPTNEPKGFGVHLHLGGGGTIDGVPETSFADKVVEHVKDIEKSKAVDELNRMWEKE